MAGARKITLRRLWMLGKNPDNKYSVYKYALFFVRYLYIRQLLTCFYQKLRRHRWSNTLNNDIALVRILFPTLYALIYKEYVVTPVQNEISGIKLERFSLLLIISWVSARKRIGSRNIHRYLLLHGLLYRV